MAYHTEGMGEAPQGGGMHTGESLYRHYCAKLLADFNCGTDSWEELPDSDREAWEYVAWIANGGTPAYGDIP